VKTIKINFLCAMFSAEGEEKTLSLKSRKLFSENRKSDLLIQERLS